MTDFDSRTHTVFKGRIVSREAARRGDWSGAERPPAASGSHTPEQIARLAMEFQSQEAANGRPVSAAEAVRHVTSMVAAR